MQREIYLCNTIVLIRAHPLCLCALQVADGPSDVILQLKLELLFSGSVSFGTAIRCSQTQLRTPFKAPAASAF